MSGTNSFCTNTGNRYIVSIRHEHQRPRKGNIFLPDGNASGMNHDGIDVEIVGSMVGAILCDCPKYIWEIAKGQIHRAMIKDNHIGQ